MPPKKDYRSDSGRKAASCCEATMRVLVVLVIFVTFALVIFLVVWGVDNDGVPVIVGRACLVDTSGVNGTFLPIIVTTPSNPIVTDALPYNIVKRDEKGGFNNDNPKKYSIKHDGLYGFQSSITVQVSDCSPVVARLIKQKDSKRNVLYTQMITQSGTYSLSDMEDPFDDDDDTMVYTTVSQIPADGCTDLSLLALTNDCGANTLTVWFSEQSS